MTASAASIERARLPAARRVIVKIGSRVLVRPNGRPDLPRMRALVEDLASLHRSGRDVVVVSSGAIACGLQALRLSHRPDDLPSLQMAAAVGQSRLMAAYDRLFSPHHIRIAQVLLTHDDLEHRRRHLNARNSLLKLLENHVIPIINENDAVAVDEIKFGDNDALASRTAMLLEADLLILLTTVNGFRIPTPSGQPRIVPFLPTVDSAALSHASGKGSPLSTGGMASKLQSAAEAARMGSAVVIASGRRVGILQAILSGSPTGTLIPPAPPSAAPNRRRRWVAFFHHAQGAVTIDDGARDALLRNGKSLLPVGVRAVEGSFLPGDLLDVLDLSGRRLAQGLSAYSSTTLRLLKGLHSSRIREWLGNDAPGEVIHRDNLVLPLSPNPDERK